MRRPAALLALALAGCSLLVEFGDECKQDGDCGDRLLCVQGLCVSTGAALGGLDASTGGQGGEGGAGGQGGRDGGGGGGPGDVADLGPAPDMSPAPDLGPAPDMGPRQLVLDDTCHTLYPPNLLAEALDPSRTILLGVLMPRTGGLGSLGPTISRAAYLAVDEINQSGGLDGRKLALLDCDDATNPEQAVRSAQRLVSLGVPAIIGAAASSATIQAFTEVARPAGVLMISPSSTTPSITDLPDDDLLWRTAPSDAIQGAAIAAHLRARGITRVAVINRDDTYGNGLREAIQDAFCADAGCGRDNYFTRRYPAEGADANHFSPILFDLQAFDPQVVVLIAFVEDAVVFLRLAAAARLERFILTDGAKETSLVEGLDAQADPLLRALIGTAPASPAGVSYQDFVLRYTGKWNGAQPGVFNAHAYDAAYLLAYAIATLPADETPTGAAIARGLRRLSSGQAIAAGGRDWNAGVRQLRTSAEATIDFRGASGPLDFGEQGEAPGDIEGWRFDVDAVEVESLGILYTADGVYNPPDLGGPGPAPDAGADAGE